MKELEAVWLEEMYEYICDNSQFIVKGFLQSGIPQALNIGHLTLKVTTSLQIPMMIMLITKKQRILKI